MIRVKHLEWEIFDVTEVAEATCLASVVMHLGIEGHLGEDLFQLEVWSGVSSGEKHRWSDKEHRLYVDELDTFNVESVIRQRLRGLRPTNWLELGEQVGAFALWEYFDYHK